MAAMDTTVATTPEDVGLSSAQLGRVRDWSQRLVDGGKLAGVTTMVARRGRVAHLHSCGLANRETGQAMTPDTIVRIYSMTKPLTSVAIMMLYEQGRFQLDDPVSQFLPCFTTMRVASGGQRGKIDTVPAHRPITIRDLLTHTSGLTYGFMQSTQVDALYRDEGIDFQTSECTLGDMVERVAALPLLAQPGAEWNYSVATDVLGHLVAVVSGEQFGEFLLKRVIEPLGMFDTDFHVPAQKHGRFAANYGKSSTGGLTLIDDPATSAYLAPRGICSGGGGLVSTAGDYMRFCRFMLNRGELDGVRLLGRKTIELMTSNHLRGDMAAMGMPRFSESSYEGVGFGLGFSVMLDPARAQIVGTPGEFAWGGAASTAFWVDPMEDLAVVMLTQLMPSSAYPIRRELRVLTYAAVVD
jgi:CubicO group peptidase (beta-lactamase class C family)